MASSPKPPQDEGADPSLIAFLRATGAAEVARTLAHLIDGVAQPVIVRVLSRKLGPGRNEQTEVEDVASEAKERLLERLLTLRGGASDAEPPIRNLATYAASLAYSTWARHLSRVYPGRAILSNQLRHLLEDRRGLRGFACWQGRTGERWCGLARWQKDRQENSRTHARVHRLISDPAAAAREAVSDQIDPKSCGLEVLLTKLFLWLDDPVEWHDLSAAIFQIHEANWKVETASAHEEAVGRIPDPLPTPHDQLRWAEYLRWLWRQTGELPLRQRTAYLLHTHTVFEWEAAGIASVHDVAGQLGLAPAHGAKLWSQLPLDDLTIAEMLSCTRQQVINLRRVARDTLGRAWQQWIAEGADSPPEIARSSRVISPVFSAPLQKNVPP